MNLDNLKSIIKKEWRIPYEGRLMRIINSFSLTEKTIFFIFVTLFIGSGISLLYQVNKMFIVAVPDYGGELVEGVIGSPRFINPLLATSDIDKDLTSIVYSGLLRVDSKGKLFPELAESYEISDDALTYTVTLKENLYFHDGVSLTADDVIFTIEKAQDPELKSPRGGNWSGVKLEKIDDRTVSFTLKQVYSPFIQNLTIGILPKHIWKTASIEEFPFSQLNINPVGSGPYQIDSISYSSSGFPSAYNFKSFSKYSLGKPYVSSLIIKSYRNEKELLEAYRNGDIESLHSVSTKQLTNLQLEKEDIKFSPLPRIFGVFFNQNVATVLANKEVRSALNMATDKQEVVDKVLGGFGQIIDGPVPPKTLGAGNSNPLTEEERIEKAKAILTQKGWKQNNSGIFQKKDSKGTQTLSFSISTGNAPELKESALLLKTQWEKIGAKVEMKIFETGDLNQNIIRPRKYDALLFGKIIGREMDLFPFWHSSQRNTPGLNIAMYTNIKADKMLENIRKTNDPELQKSYFNSFNKEIKSDLPAVFTYSPYFLYIIPKKIQSVSLGTLTSPSERFSDVYKWYIETNNVWRIFIKK
ncbi:MAG: hypothetical protein EXS47_01275 [Candidatus Zambryskibacteria bacterium]|nr:hypothetical protein [Candidatus Zambryskibacteria bacterium]